MPLNIKTQLQFSERYTEYIDNSTNTRTEDYVSSPLASLQLTYQPSLFHLEGDYSVGPTFSSNDSSQNSINQQGSIAFSADRPRWSTTVKGSLVSTRFPDLISQYNGGIMGQGNGYLQEGGDLNWSYLLDKTSALSFNYDYVHNAYNTASLTDSETQTAGSSLSYEAGANRHFSFSGTASLYRYQEGANSKSAVANVGWVQQLSRHLSLQMGAGVGLTSGYNRFFLANLNVSRSYERGSVQAGYSRSLSPGGGLTSVPALNQQGNLSVSREFSENLSGTISASYGESFASQADSDIYSRTWSGTLSINYRLAQWLSSSFSLSRYDQRVDGRSSENLQSNLAVLSLSSNFSDWRPFK